MTGSRTHRYSTSLTRGILCAMAALVALAADATAQHRYDEWHFGYGKSMRFDAGGPVALTGSSMGALQGCASICDPVTGRLLFYTNGATVWNNQHKQMPNGTMLAGGNSAVQAALIVPMPEDADRYYVFTTDETETSQQPNGYYYSIVDTRRDGGRGEVTVKNVQLLPESSEHQTAVRHCNGRDFWVITHANTGNSFYAFLVGPGGVSLPPVVSTLGAFTDGYGHAMGRSPQGAIKASPDGTRLAATFGDGKAELYRFDRLTGRISDAVRLRDVNAPFYHPGVSFSPDGSRVYISFGPELLQFSVDSGDPATIVASRAVLSDAPGADLQLGPDGKIYRAEPGGIGVIREPNREGRSCGYQVNAMPMAVASFGLPNNIDALDAASTTLRASISRELTASPGQIIEAPILASAPPGGAAPGPITIRLRYDSTMLRLITDDPLLGTTADGTLLDGWGMSIVTDKPGRFVATFTPPPGATPLPSGTLLHLRFRTFISAAAGGTPALVSELPLEVESPGACGPVLSSAGRAELTLCGLSLRMIEITSAKYALDDISPNPVRDRAEIRFSIGLDGPTRLELFDATGESVALLIDREIEAGDHLITLDATRFPSGLYYCRLTSGSWMATRVLLIQQ